MVLKTCLSGVVEVSLELLSPKRRMFNEKFSEDSLLLTKKVALG